MGVGFRVRRGPRGCSDSVLMVELGGHISARRWARPPPIQGGNTTTNLCRTAHAIAQIDFTYQFAPRIGGRPTLG